MLRDLGRRLCGVHRPVGWGSRGGGRRAASVVPPWVGSRAADL